MIVNDGKILGNTGNIFRAQIVESFIQLNSPYNNQLYITLSGMTSANPFHVYYETPSGTTKYNYDYDDNIIINFAATNETSYKKFYFSGNLNAVTGLEFNKIVYYTSDLYHGDLIKLMNQFPNLRSFKMNMNINNYNFSSFNQDISNAEFPVNLNTFHVGDATLSANINTINLDNVSDLQLVNVLFTGSLNTGFTHLNKLSLDYLNYLNGNINTILANNPNLESLDIAQCVQIGGNATTLDVSNLNFINLNVENMSNFIGNPSGWTFNTGLTSFILYNQYLDGDITNWDFTNTHLNNFIIYGSQNNYPVDSKLSGSLSGWTFPNTIQSFSIYFVSGITSVPINYTGNTLLSSVTYYALNNVDQDINDFKFNNNIQGIQFYYFYGKGKLHGDIGTFVIPLSATSITFNNASLTGDISLITLTSKLNYFDVSYNYLSGDVIDMTIPNSLTGLNVNSNSGVTFTLSNTPYFSGKTSGVFHTKNMNGLNVNNISGITGNLSNLIIDNTFSSLYMYSNNNFYCDLSKLNISNIYNFNATNCLNLYGDLSNWFTGTTICTSLDLSGDEQLSGDTGGWNLNNFDYFVIDYTNLSGQLKWNNVNHLQAASTKISSNIATDFNFSNGAYWVDLRSCQNLIGNLSGVTLKFSQVYFYINGCTGITGSDSFIDYLFINRKNFNGYSLSVGISNIGDSVTDGTRELGDTGTFPLGTGGTGQWDLTESQVNFLVAGLDYTGIGSSTPWTQGQKVYWMENANISSINGNRRYITYNISYDN